MEKHKTIVRINGANYTISGYESENYIRAVANTVDKKIKEFIKANPKLNNELLNMLTAINMADDKLKAEEMVGILQEKMQALQEENRSLKLQLEIQKQQRRNNRR